MLQKNAIDQWYTSQNTNKEEEKEEPQDYSRVEQLYDEALWEATYGEPEKKQWYFALCERLLEKL